MTPMQKKEIAAAARITLQTMRNHRKQWHWIEQYRTNCPGRPTYNRVGVTAELRKRRII